VQKPEEVLSVGDKVMAKVISIDPNERKIGLSLREYQRDKEEGIEAGYRVSGDATVSIGDVIGNAIPKSLLNQGDPTAAANEMMAEMGEAAKSESDAVEPSSDADKAE